MSKMLENEERSEKIAGVHPELEAESRQLEMESKMNKRKQHSMSTKTAQGKTIPFIANDDEDELEDGSIEKYKEEKEEEENESRYSPEEVGLMASKYPYAAMYKNVRVEKNAKSSWFTVTNGSKPVAIIPAGQGDMVDKRAADITARHILQDIAKGGLVDTVKKRSGRIAQAGDPGAVGGGVRDFVSLSDDTRDQSVVGRPNTDFTPERIAPPLTTTEQGVVMDRQMDYPVKGLDNSTLDEQVTDMLGRRVPPGMPLNVTDREESDMRPARPEKSVMDNVLAPRTTDMKNARKNPWLVKARVGDEYLGGEPNPIAKVPPTTTLPSVIPTTTSTDPMAMTPEQQAGFDTHQQEQSNIVVEKVRENLGPSPMEYQAPMGPGGYTEKLLGPQIPAIGAEGSKMGGNRNPWLKQKRAVSPPGWGKNVEDMKKHKDDIDNPWELARDMDEKGYEPGGKESRRNPWLMGAQLPSGGTRPLPIAEVPKGIQVAEPEEEGRPLPVVKQFEPLSEGGPGPQANKKLIQVTADNFKLIVADMEKRMKEKASKSNDTWKRAYKERFIRALLLAADRQRLNQEPCQLKVSFGDVMSESGMDPDYIYNVVEAAFNVGSKPYADSIIRQAMQFVEMPQEAFLTIEADVKKLRPADIRNAQLNNEEVEENDDVEEENGNGDEEMLEEENGEEENGEDEIEARCKPKAKRVQASKGNMMLAPTPNIHTGGSGRFPGLRTALRSPLTDKFPSLTKI